MLAPAPFFEEKSHLLVRDVFAAIDESQDDIAQRRQGEAQPCASFPIFAKGFHTTAEVDEVQAAAASRHCHGRGDKRREKGLRAGKRSPVLHAGRWGI